MNKTEFATELLARYGGIPEPMRGMIREAANRLLQLVPDVPFVPGLQEAKWLRQLADKWPVIEDPRNDVAAMSTEIHDTCISAANRLEQMAETIAYARTIQAERDAMAAYLKNTGGCDNCKHHRCDVDADPCESCMNGEDFPAWEWKGD